MKVLCTSVAEQVTDPKNGATTFVASFAAASQIVALGGIGDSTQDQGYLQLVDDGDGFEAGVWYDVELTEGEAPDFPADEDGDAEEDPNPKAEG